MEQKEEERSSEMTYKKMRGQEEHDVTKTEGHFNKRMVHGVIWKQKAERN